MDLKDAAIRPSDRQCSNVVEVNRPATFMHLVVMLAAQGDEVVEMGLAAVFPRLNVVHLAPGEGCVTPNNRA